MSFLILGTQIRLELLPIASQQGRLAIDTVTGTIYVDTGNAGTGWTPLGGGGGGIPPTIIDARGDLIVGLAPDTPTRLGVGADGFVLTADPAEATGIKWAATAGGAVLSVFGRTGAVVSLANDYEASEVQNIPAGSISAVTVQAAVNELDTEKQPIDADLSAIAAISTNGLLTRTGAGTATTRTILPGTGIGVANGDGVAGDPSISTTAILPTIVDAKGDLIVASAADTVARLPVGADTQVLTADAAETLGVKWAPSGSAPVSSVFTRTGAVVAVAGDYDAVQVDNTPTGGISATNVQAAIDELDAEKQPLDADLTAIAGLAGTGLIARTGAGTAAARSIAGGTGISVSNGDGAAGNPTVSTSAILPTIVDAKGDLIAGTAADTVARLPVGSNGQVLTADSAETTGIKWAAGGGAGTWTTVFKSADETIASDATFSDDASLVFAMAANTRYAVRGRIFFDTGVSPDIKFTLNGPASPTRVRYFSFGNGATQTTLDAIFSDTAYGGTHTIAVSAASGGWWQFDAVIENGANAGNFAVQWAQNTSNAANTTVLRNSYIEWAEGL